MKMLARGVKRHLRGVVIGALLLSLLPLTAAALGSLDEPQEPVLALDIQGLLTAPQEPLGAPLSHFLPTPKPKPVFTVRSQPVKLPGDMGAGIWDCIARKESGNRPLGCAPHCGRLQWLPSTWRAAGGTRYAPLPQYATYAQEVEIARAWLAKTSWDQWPNTSRMCGAR